MVVTEVILIMRIIIQSNSIAKRRLQNYNRGKGQTNRRILVVTKKERRPVLQDPQATEQGHQVARLQDARPIFCPT